MGKQQGSLISASLLLPNTFHIYGLHFSNSVACGNKYKYAKAKSNLLECYILFWTAQGYVTPIESIMLTCSFLAAVSILGFFVSYFKQIV